MKKTLMILTILAVFSMVTVAMADSHKSNPFEGNSDAIAKGKELFMENCTECHGNDAKGGTGPDLTDNEWWYGGSDEEVLNSISNGQGFSMPAWLNNPLSKEDIWKVIAFIRSLNTK